MKTRLHTLLIVTLLSSSSLSAQADRLPRDSEKLIARARSFWSFMATGQRLKALDFVVPEKKESFLASPAIPMTSAQVVGLNLTRNLSQATVRVQINAIAMTTAVTGPPPSFAVDSDWVWKAGTWYVDVGDPRQLMTAAGSSLPQSVEQMQKEIEDNLRLPKTLIDIGTVVRGPQVLSEIPVEYAGKLPLSVENASQYPFIFFGVQGGSVSQKSKHFQLRFDTSEWVGDFSIPIKVRFKHEAVSIERLITLQGNVFAPVTFRQVPPDSATPDGRITVFIRNNTSERIELEYITVDGKLDVLKDAKVLEPNAETETVFRLRLGETPDNLLVLTRQPVRGIGVFAYHFRTGR